MSGTLVVMILSKGVETYCVAFLNDQRAQALRSVCEYAADPDLSFSWYDAAMMIKEIRRLPEWIS